MAHRGGVLGPLNPRLKESPNFIFNTRELEKGIFIIWGREISFWEGGFYKRGLKRKGGVPTLEKGGFLEKNFGGWAPKGKRAWGVNFPRFFGG